MPKSDSARKPKPKLPKVWVALDENGVTWCGHDRDYADHAGFTLHQYAPVQPPRRCVWYDSDAEFFRGSCDAIALYPYGFDYIHCPMCGGKIVKKS